MYLGKKIGVFIVKIKILISLFIKKYIVWKIMNESLQSYYKSFIIIKLIKLNNLINFLSRVLSKSLNNNIMFLFQ